MEDSIQKKLSKIMDDDDLFFQAEIRIGPFKLLDQIGKGKFATVSLGIHEETKEKVAIKQIKKSELNTDNLLTKEINIHKTLFHPYLTKMYCVIEKEDNIFIITEYCSKGDLLNYLIDNGVFTEEQSCKIFQQVLSSLDYLHKNNICHRDIKPENILLDEYGDAKLSDFGLSRKFEKNDILKTPCGSPMYAAPEMVLGKPYDGTKIDIWSLGISLFTMVCGELPFDVEDDDMKTLVYNITHGIYTIPDNLSPQCKDLISKILEINPDKRITIDDIKKHSWVNMFNLNYMKSPGVFLDEYYLPIDIYLIKEIKGEDENEIRKMINDILMNKHNVNTINYYLKNEGKKRKGEKSVSDLRATSELFIEYINDEISKKKKWNNDIKKIGDYYTNKILDLFQNEKMKKLEIQKEIKDSLKIDNNNNENINRNQDKKYQMLKFKTELKFNNNNSNNEENQDNKTINKNQDNQDKEKEKDKDKKIDINNISNNINIKDKQNINTRKNHLEIVNLYIGPLIFIHDLIDNIITKVINLENEKNEIKVKNEKKKSSNFLVSSSIKMEITKSEKNKNESFNNDIITKENEIKLFKEKSERLTSYQEQYRINKANNIELVSTPKRIKTSFSYVNKVQSESVEINCSKNNDNDNDDKVIRGGSCKLRNKKKKLTHHNFKSRSLAVDKGRKIQNKNVKINKTKTDNIKSKIIKSIDLTRKGIISTSKKTNILKRKIKSISNINHLQINIIQNEIIIADNNFIKKSNLKNKNEIGLIKNHSQNYFFILNENINFETKSSKRTLTNRNTSSKSKPKIRNKIPFSKFHNRSVDTKTKKSSKKEPISIKKNKNVNKEILIPVRKEKNYFNKFLNTPNNKDKYNIGISSNQNSFYSPYNKNQGIVKNIFLHDTTAPLKKGIIPLKSKKNKSIIFINNMNKDFNEINHNHNSNKYNNHSKKNQEKNNQHNSQIISFFSNANDAENAKKNKNINISIYQCSKSPNKDYLKQNNTSMNNMFGRKTCNNNNNQVKIVKTENCKEHSQNKKKNKNNKSIESEKGDDKLLKSKLSLNKIKQIIKKYVGNNVIESKDNGIFKYICKTKFGKDELIFHLELISKTYDSFTLKGILVKGETKWYKELISKIKEKIM